MVGLVSEVLFVKKKIHFQIPDIFFFVKLKALFYKTPFIKYLKCLNSLALTMDQTYEDMKGWFFN